MPVLHAIVLGLVQGLSEFLPISSSGHLELVPWLFGWDDFAGDADIERAFDVAVHLGTLVGAVAYFRRDLLRLAVAAVTGGRKVARRSAPPAATTADGPSGHAAPDRPPGRLAERLTDDERIAWLLALSVVPAVIVGLTLEDVLERTGESKWLIGVLLVAFGLVLWWADRLGGDRPTSSWSRRDAITMGVAQALALQPGVSRSGVTITAGRWLGLDRDAAARLSFLMSVPVIAGAGVFAFLELPEGGLPPGFAAPFAWATVTAALSGYVAVWGTIRLVRTRSFAPFVVYRVLFGIAVVGIALSGLR